jgi:hypothetical protein
MEKTMQASPSDQASSTLDVRAFYFSDFLGRPLLKLANRNWWVSALAGAAFFGIIMIGGGWLVSLRYASTPGFLPIYDHREIGWVIFVYLIVGPVIWATYAKEPYYMQRTYRDLLRNGVFPEPDQDKSVKEFVEKSMKPWKRMRLFFAVIVILISVMALWFSTQAQPTDLFRFGATRFWWSVNPLCYVAWTILNFSLTYMLTWTVLRRLATWITTAKLLHNVSFKPILFHPDGCNGLFPVGKYTFTLTPLFAISGLWLATSTVYPAFFGESINVKYDTITYIVLYLLLIPLVLIVSTWFPHREMKQRKNTAQQEIADAVQRLLQQLPTTDSYSHVRNERNTASVPQDIRHSVEDIEALERLYNVVERRQAEWPFRMPSAERYIAITGLPGITSVAVLVFREAVTLAIHKYFPSIG